MYLSRGDCPQRVLKLVRYPATRFLGEPPTGVKFNIVCVCMCMHVCVCVLRAHAPVRVCMRVSYERASERASALVARSLCRATRDMCGGAPMGAYRTGYCALEEKAESSIDPLRRDLRPYEIGTLMVALT